MRFKRSSCRHCPNCNITKGLDVKIDAGGLRYRDMYAIECVFCGGARGGFEYSVPEAIETWNEWVDRRKKTQESSGQTPDNVVDCV